MKRIQNFLTAIALVAGLPVSVSVCAEDQADFSSLSNFLRDSDDLIEKSTHDDIKDSSKKVDDFVAKIDNNAEMIKRFSQFSIEEIKTKDQTKWGIRINLPGFTAKEITVNVSTQEGTVGSKNVLEAVAAHKKPVVTKEIIEKEGKAKVIKVSSQHMSSSTVINGKKREISYTDGVLTIKMDLPQTVDVEDYTMKFDEQNDQLTIEFARKEKAPQKRNLTFTQIK
jgi:HSP20 family molecular chaperone IbpA